MLAAQEQQAGISSQGRGSSEEGSRGATDAERVAAFVGDGTIEPLADGRGSGQCHICSRFVGVRKVR